ncbi:hypothetical protein C8T65DRAFT_630377 [Cerioporus squamosus]|nr:hypothetical protein C8T65DRAFT_630377 [Cerioporus squamosus]
MFDLFKKKEDDGQAEGLTENRVGKTVGRPKTAPVTFGASPKLADNVTASTIVNRHSADEGLISRYTLKRSPEPLTHLNESTSSQFPSNKDLPPLPSRPTLGGPPVSDRSLSEASCELRNPFRSNTSDSINTTSMSRTSSFAEAAIPVQRMVPTLFPEQTDGIMDPLPHKAAIFTSHAHGLGIFPDPFPDESSGPEDRSVSTTPIISFIHSHTEDSTRTPKRSRWSFLKSPKHSAQDFLQVHIPSGVFSPPTRQRHSFWSRA